MNRVDFVQITRNQKIPETEFQEMMNSMYVQTWSALQPPQILTDDLAIKIEDNIITPPDSPIPDCVTCGGCCVALPRAGVRPDDELAPEYYWDITIEGAKEDIVVDRFIRRDGETFACIALNGTLGENVSCGIYDGRPTVCRKFEAGSDKCHAIRRAYGFEPFLSLMDMYFATQKLKAAPEKYKSSEIIAHVNINEQTGSGNLEIAATMNDGSVRVIHTYDPSFETWRQFEFDGLPLVFVKEFVETRRGKADNSP